MTSSRKTSTDRILRAIDGGLQSSTETASTEPLDDPAACVRCTDRQPVEGSDFCGPCRAWMLGDSANDPARPTPQRRYEQSLSLFEALVENSEASRPARCHETPGRVWVTTRQPGPFVLR